MAVRTREIYRSANGDRWLLARDPDTGRVFVRHEPNLPSGRATPLVRAIPPCGDITLTIIAASASNLTCELLISVQR